MSRREAWLSALLVFGAALVVRAWAATVITFPRPEDAAYYVGVAKNLVEGRGLVSDAIWSFQTPPLTFPRPAFEVWLPLPSFLYAIPMLVLGTTFTAAQVASSIVGGLVAVLGWRLGADVALHRGLSPARRRALAIGTGLTAAAYLPLVLASVEPDSTIPFAAIVLAAFVVIGRTIQAPTTRGLVVLGLLIGLAALTRNEAVWLALVWVIVALGVALRSKPVIGRRRLTWARLVGIPGLVALGIYVPWVVRDWLTFGTPLPGQTLANALMLRGSDIFAWSDPPTLERYLAAGLGTLVDLRVMGFLHNAIDVLVLLGVPVSVIGLIGIPYAARAALPIRPLLAFAVVTFVETTLIFPVATVSGTFLHAAGAVEVLLVMSALLALDWLIERVGRFRGWTRPVAWLGPALTISAAILFTLQVLPAEGAAARVTEAQYRALPAALAAAGVPLDAQPGPVVTDHAIWFATTTGHTAIALPDEDPASIVDLASRFGASILVVDNNSGRLPDTDPGAPEATCFTPLTLTHLGDDPDPLAGVTVYRIRCP